MAAVQAILPIFLLILLGYWIGRRQWLTSDAASGLSTLTFKLFMPLVLFTGIARANLAEGLSPHLLLAYFLPALGLFAITGLSSEVAAVTGINISVAWMAWWLWIWSRRSARQWAEAAPVYGVELSECAAVGGRG